MTSKSSFDDTFLIPGPPFHIDLSALDARHPIHYGRRLLIFRCASPEQRDAQLAAFKTGLQGLVLRCPILGGIVVPPTSHGHGDCCTIVPGQGIELIVRDLRKEMFSFNELEAANFPSQKLPYDLLVPVPQNLANDRPFAACKFQFSAIEGGTIITFSMSHSVADGSGNNELTRILSEETRLASEGVMNEVRSIVDQDRSVIRNMTSDMPFNIEQHPGYTWTTMPEQSVTHPFKATSPEIPVLLRISATSLAQLKTDATLPEAPPISTHDALTALIWRSVLLIRSRRSTQEMPLSTMGSVFFPSDARRHLKLPASYVGNAVYQLTALLELSTLLSPTGLPQAAKDIRRAIMTVNPALVSSLLAMTRERWVDWAFETMASTTGVAMGTDWTSGLLYDQDWGEALGPLVRYRYPDEPGIAILPKLPDGTAEVMVSVLPEEVEVLESVDCFGKYLGWR